MQNNKMLKQICDMLIRIGIILLGLGPALLFLIWFALPVIYVLDILTVLSVMTLLAGISFIIAGSVLSIFL